MFKYFAVLICTLFCLITSLCFGQTNQQKIDSLNILIENHRKEDAVRTNLLLDISVLSINTTDPAIGLRYAKEAMNIAEKLNQPVLLARTYIHIGNALNYQYKYKEAISYREKALVIFKDVKSGDNVSNTLFNLGNDYFRLNEWIRALGYYTEAYDIIKNLNVPMGEFACLAQIANCYSALSNHTKAVDNHFLALKVAEKMKNDLSISIAYTGIGNEYRALGDNKRALDYYQKSLALKEKVGERRGQNIVVSNMASVYFSQGNIAAALEYHKKSLELGISMDNKQTQLVAHSGIGNALLTQNKNEEALISFNKALKLGEELKDQNLTAATLLEIGSIQIRKGNYNEAESTLDKAKSMFIQIQALDGRRNTYEKYTELYEAKKDYSKAYDSYKTYVILRDSIANSEIVKESEKKEMQYDFDKKESVYLLNAQLADQKLNQERIISIQQQQALLLQKQKLSLSDKEKSLQRLTFLKKQADLESDRKLQASKFQQAKLHAGYVTSLRDKQISKQDQQIKFDFWVKMFLSVAIALALLSVIIIFLNNRKTKRLNNIINTQKGELEHLNKVKDRIFSVVSHDMRTPVNSLISFIQLLEHGTIEQEKLKGYSAVLKNTLTYTSSMMDNLLNWAASQMQGFDPVLESLNVHEIVQSVILSMESTASQKRLVIKNEVPANASCISDANMLARVVNNLVGNAIKFTPNLGEIVIAATTVDNMLHITISDNGKGLTTEQVEHFNSPGNLGAGKSTPGTNNEKGTGLGLLLCKTFVGIMNGTIRAENSTHGSTFILSFSKSEPISII